MSRLTHVRHGQASFFEDDYDKLSATGEEQARVLAEYWIRNGVTYTETYAGTLKRQIRTAEIVAETMRAAGLDWPDHETLDGLNEYDADAVMKILLPELRAREDRFQQLSDEFDGATDGPDRYRTFHRLLEAVMAEYVGGDYDANGFETWKEFSGRVRGAFKTILERGGSGRRVAVFSSGGPVGISVQTALDAPEIKACELNWRVHNCSLTEFTFSANRFTLDAFNAVPHLTDPELLTYR
ncbi:MAG: histidine phosphatase family protein [Candidatus Hydrogenedentes bacterium]|nr:histidine phosphatase family protein [Candidatus Hydrogenedentota bacterium]